MTRLIRRLQGVQLHVLPPEGSSSDFPRPPAEIDAAAIRELRARVYVDCGLLRPIAQASTEDADNCGWHLVATRESQLVGCIRLVMFGPEEAEAIPALALANSRCEFSMADRNRCLAAIREQVRVWRGVGGDLFIQVGGLAVLPDRRNSAVAPALCLGSNAFCRSIGCAAGILFASEKSGNVTLYAKAGCLPLNDDAGPLGYLDDSFHRDRMLVMGFDPDRIEPELVEAVEALQAHLLREVAPTATTLNSQQGYARHLPAASGSRDLSE